MTARQQFGQQPTTRIFLVSLMTILVWSPTLAQVSNNEISQRITLGVNAPPLVSTTERSTVQPDCINKSLTASCLVYHNDQWFTFSVLKTGRYFVNFSGVQCRDKRGIQMLVLEGDPCVVQTYSVVECINRLATETAYVVLDSLKPNVAYLLNIDGFLGDQCSFTIQVADHASGFPHIPSQGNSLAEFALEDSIVAIRISMDPNEQHHYSGIQVYRKYADDNEAPLTSIQLARGNALGDYQSEYEFHDTLSVVGPYRYRAYAVHSVSNELTFLGARELVYYGASSPSQFVGIPVSMRAQKEIRVRLIHPPDGKILYEYTTSGQAQRIGVDFKRHIKAGYRDFAVEFSSPASGEVHVLFYRATSDDHVSRLK